MGHLGRTQKSQAASEKKLKAYACELEQKLEARTRELSEALEQQTATSEVLRVISSSPGDLKPVFETMLANATRLCEAKFGTLFLYEHGVMRAVALHNAPPIYAEARRREPEWRPPPGSGLSRIILTRGVLHIADITKDSGYVWPLNQLTGARTILMVPMLKDDVLVGVIGIYRQEIRPFSDKQVELLVNFAAQAVVAIENTRLLNELRQRTDDLSESLEQQTATAEVLQVISSSPGELEPVFQTMLENATRICEAKYGSLLRYDGKMFHQVAGLNLPPALAEFVRQRGPFAPAPGGAFDRAIKTKMVIHTEDDAVQEIPTVPAKLGGARSYIAVPMLKENEIVGAFVIYRQEVRPFTDKQIALVQNFAAQAVIAIENTPRRSKRIAGATDGDLTGAERHLELAGRPQAGVQYYAGERDTAMRGQIRRPFP